MKRILLRTAILTCGMLGLLRGLEAAPLDNRIPGDAAIYAGWAGSDALAPAYEGSNLKGIVDNIKIGDYVRDNWANWMEMIQEKSSNADAAANINDGMTVLKVLWRHPGAFYVGPMGLADMKKPTFKLAFLCDAGADAGTLMDIYKRSIAKDPPPPDAKVQIAQDGNFIILTLGDISSDDFKNANAQGQRLPAAPDYVAAMTQVQKDPALAVYVDVQKIIGTIGEAVKKAPNAPAEAKKAVPEVLKALGLTSVTQVALSSGFDKKEWSEQGFIGLDGPRVGLIALLDAAPVSDAALAMVPKDVASMNIGRLDLMKTMASVRDVVGKVDPNALAQFEKGIAMADQQLGLDIEKDVINALGDEWVAYRGPVTDEGVYPFAMVQKLRDPAAFAKTLDVAEKQFNIATQGKLKIEKLDAGKFEVTGVRLPQMMAGTPSSFAWTIRNGIFYVSTVEGIEAVVNQVEQKGESITANAGYKAVRAALPAANATSISYSEPAHLYPAMYRTVMGLLPMARLAGLDIPADLLPMPRKVAPFMTPCGSISWSDANGIHFASHSAFPGAEALGGQVSPVNVAFAGGLGTAILLPSLGKAREFANRSYSAANLRGIAQSCIVWSAENNDKMPDHVGVLILTNQINSKQLVSKRVGTEPLVVTEATREKAKTDFAGFAKDVDAHCDYVYLGAGTTNTTDSSVVLAYEKNIPGITDGLNLVFMDCHVEFTRWAGIPEAFKATNEYRKGLKLPEVDVAALSRPAGR